MYPNIIENIQYIQLAVDASHHQLHRSRLGHVTANERKQEIVPLSMMVVTSEVNQMFLAMHTRRTGSHLHHVRGRTHVREESYYSPYSCRSQAWKMPAEVLAVNVSCDINTTAYVQEVTKRTIRWFCNDSAANLIILTSSLMLTESGTRNLVLSSKGRLFSPWYRSIITFNHTINLPCIRIYSLFSTPNPYHSLIVKRQK